MTKMTICMAIGIYAVVIGGIVACYAVYDISVTQACLYGAVQLSVMTYAWRLSQSQMFKNHIMHNWIKKAGKDGDDSDTNFVDDIRPIKQKLLKLIELEEKEKEKTGTEF
jgi:hypothetical protein